MSWLTGPATPGQAGQAGQAGMSAGSEQPERPDEVLAACAAALLDAAEAALAPWVLRCVEGRWRDWTGQDPDDALLGAAAEAGRAAQEETMAALRRLLGADVEQQWTGPLAVLRRAVAHPTAVLRAAGMPPVVRDDFAVRSFPDDDYDLSPAGFADIDESLHEPGLIWGAAKAHVVLTRRRARP